MPSRLNDTTPLRWRTLTRDDLDAVSELLTAVEHLDDPASRHSLDELVEQFHQAEAADANAGAVVGFAGETLLAFGWNVADIDAVAPRGVPARTVQLRGAVHPGWRFQGIGRALLAWQIDRAQEWFARSGTAGTVVLTAFVDDKLQAQRDLYERSGLLPRRWYADMHRRFPGPEAGGPPEDLRPGLDPSDGVVVPEGLVLRPFTSDLAEATRLAHNEAFAEIWGSRPVGRVSWQESLSRSSARPEWSWLVLDRARRSPDRVIGYAMNAAYPQDWAAQGFSEGWTERLGVRTAYRGRGVAKALLTASMRSFAATGLEGAGLGVDSENPFGAVGLYRALGYVSADTVLRYQREIEVPAGRPSRGKAKKKS